LRMRPPTLSGTRQPMSNLNMMANLVRTKCPTCGSAMRVTVVSASPPIAVYKCILCGRAIPRPARVLVDLEEK